MQQVPFNQVAFQPLPPGAPPPQLVGLQVVGNLVNFAGHLVAQAITDIQDGLRQSYARVYFFNLMAANNYDNLTFRQVVFELSQYVELMCMVNNEVPVVTIPKVTPGYITFKVAQAALQNPLLLQQMGQQTQMAMLDTVNQFQAIIARIRASMGQQQQPGMQPSGGFMAGAPGFAGGGNMGMAMGQGPGGGFMTGVSGFSGGGASGMFTDNRSVSFTPSGADNGMNLTSATAGNYAQAARETAATPAPVAANVVSLDSAAAGPTLFSTASEVVSANVSTGATVPTSAPPPVQLVEAHVVSVGDRESVKWMPSVKYPVLPTFDPNTQDLKFHVYSDGTIEPLISQRGTMDRQAHLSPISVTPKFVAMSQELAANNPATADQKDAHQIVNPEQIQEVLYPGNADTSLTNKQNWTLTEAHLLSVRHKYPEKYSMVLKYSMLLDTLLGSAKIVTLIANLGRSQNVGEAVGYLKTAMTQAAYEQNNRDMRAIAHIARRLTQRVNRFVYVDMSLTFARIDDYVEDGEAQIPFIANQLGTAVADTLKNAHKRIISEAVGVADESLAAIINEAEFELSKIPENEGVEYIHLYNNVVYGVVDLSTIELRAEIPKEGYSVLINEASTPLLSDLAKRLFNKKTAQAKFGAGLEVERHLLRTNDGVVLEFAQAAFAGSGIVVAKYVGE